MKFLFVAFICLSSIGSITAQPGPESIDKIPLPAGFKPEEGDPPFVNEMYREELSGTFLNPEKAGLYKSYALKTTQIRRFKPPEDMGTLEQEAYDFYITQFNATIIDIENKEHLKLEPDLGLLKPGEGTAVLFYPSFFGGGVFKWYFHNGDIKELTIVISSPLMLLERTFVKDLEVVFPAQDELDFPLYPGAEFQPLKSSLLKNPSGPGSRKFIYQTTHTPEQVTAYFEKQLLQKASASESGSSYSFLKRDPLPGSYQFSSLTISKEIPAGSNSSYTVIEYYKQHQ